MGIQNFPASLQPIIQQGFLEYQFEQALVSELAYRSIADRENFPNAIGETITKTRAGLKGTVTTPMTASANTNLDNGLTSTNWSVEQYSLSIAMYAATQDLNTVTNRVGIVEQFLQNAYTNGEQARRSLDELARNALFAPYMGGNTRVITTLGSPNVTIHVDDIRGFQYAPSTTGFTSAAQILTSGSPSPTMQPVSSSNTVSVIVGSNTYTLQGATADGTNISTAFGGISGTLTFSATVLVADATAGNSVVAANASTIKRPNGRGNTSLLQQSDTLTMGNLLDAVASLRANGVPTIDGAYNAYMDPVSARELFADPDFKQLYQGATGTNAAFKNGAVVDFLGLRFVWTTEAPVQAHPTLSGLFVRRPIICGRGAIIEGDFEGIAAQDVAPKDSIINVVDGVAMVTREPLDRLQQIIAQSWYWIGGFCAPSDVTTTPTTLPTANSAVYKRAVVIEHIG
jgi:hypothetical protein